MNWPLMRNNITREDREALIAFLQATDHFTQGEQVRLFEEEWSRWLGVRHSVFVNSGASANLLTMQILREIAGAGEVVVPTLTWVSDITSVLRAGFRPVFVDIDSRTLGMDEEEVLRKLNRDTRAVFLTHVLGFNALSERLLRELEARQITLVEDVCESHGATFQGRKLGTFGLASNFSFYYAHHLSVGEGGMICTDREEVFDLGRALRSHGMVREAPRLQERWVALCPDLSPDFIFAYEGYNARNDEMGAVLGRSQLRRLDENNRKRRENLSLFLSGLGDEFCTDFAQEGSCNYAFPLVLRQPNASRRDRVEAILKAQGIEYRRGLSGGGNQLRQPYLKLGIDPRGFPRVEHVHFYGYYLGNYPDLEHWKIESLCEALRRDTWT